MPKEWLAEDPTKGHVSTSPQPQAEASIAVPKEWLAEDPTTGHVPTSLQPQALG